MVKITANSIYSYGNETITELKHKLSMLTKIPFEEISYKWHTKDIGKNNKIYIRYFDIRYKEDDKEKTIGLIINEYQYSGSNSLKPARFSYEVNIPDFLLKYYIY